MSADGTPEVPVESPDNSAKPREKKEYTSISDFGLKADRNSRHRRTMEVSEKNTVISSFFSFSSKILNNQRIHMHMQMDLLDMKTGDILVFMMDMVEKQPLNSFKITFILYALYFYFNVISNIYFTKIFEKILETNPDDIEAAFSQAFLKCDEDIGAADIKFSGTTVVASLIHVDENQKKRIYTANAGDARAVLA